MPETSHPIDPTDIAGINQRTRAWAGPGETITPIRIGRILVEDDALEALVDVVAELTGGGPTLLVVDRTAMSRGGDDLKSRVESALTRTGPVTVRRLPENEAERFHADLEPAQRLARDVPRHAAVVSVGSGSITDVAKYARDFSARDTGSRAAFISFPTAASVTAYTSALAVLTVDGVKRTLPAKPPDAIVCDLQTLADAPAAMTRAGFGDVLARSVAYGDWFLAGQLGMDDGFSHVPGRLLEPAERAMIQSAESVAQCAPDGVRAVTEAILLAGMAMSIVNQTAPISGWEHVISHFLDLTAAHDRREPALHGAQVGVATLIAARAYERTWGELDLDRLAAELTERDVTACRETIERVFASYDPTGRLRAEVWRDVEKKLSRWRAAAPTRRAFAERKRAGEFDGFMREAVRPADKIATALARADAPTTFAGLTEPIPPATALAAVRSSHLIRARFTLGDLLEHSGWLDEANARGLLD